MSGFKKGLTQSHDRAVRYLFDGVSKAALMDLVIDLIRQNEGDERLDGPELVKAIEEAREATRVIRRDTVAPLPPERDRLAELKAKLVAQ